MPVAEGNGTDKPDPVAVTDAPDTALPSVGLPDWAWALIGIGSAAVVGVVIWLLVAYCYSFLAYKGGKNSTKKT